MYVRQKLKQVRINKKGGRFHGHAKLIGQEKTTITWPHVYMYFNIFMSSFKKELLKENLIIS